MNANVVAKSVPDIDQRKLKMAIQPYLQSHQTFTLTWSFRETRAGSCPELVSVLFFSAFGAENQHFPFQINQSSSGPSCQQ